MTQKAGYIALLCAAAPAPPAVGTGGDERASGTGGPEAELGARPRISAEQQTRIETSSLHFRSVTPTGSRCGA